MANTTNNGISGSTKNDKVGHKNSLHKNRLTKNGIICGLIIIASTGIFVHLTLLFSDKNQEKNLLTNSVKSQIAVNREALSASKTINQLSKNFKQEIDLGTVGFVNRLQWTDSIKQSAALSNINDINFILKETILLDDPEHPLYQDGLRINTIEMELSLGTRHEGVVYDFFERLKGAARGSFTIEKCEITRALVSVNTSTAAFQTSCTVQWFVIDNPINPTRNDSSIGANL